MRLGVDLGGTKIEAVVLDSVGEVAWRKRVPTPQGNYELTVSTIVQLVAEAKRAMRMPDASPVGIGTPGALTLGNPSKMPVMKNCNSTALNGRPLLDDLISALSCPVSMANDANCFALAETLSGQGKQLSFDNDFGGGSSSESRDLPETVFGVILGTGVGGGVVVNGKVLHGVNAIAGEWGHNPLPARYIDSKEDARLCYCGRENCIETYLSGPGLALSFQRQINETISPEQLIERVREGHSGAKLVWHRYKQQLATSLAQVVNILDPSLVVLGGGLSSIPELYDDIAMLMAPHVFTDSFQTPILPALLGDSAGVYGAAWLTD